jgi:hypothetical protein
MPEQQRLLSATGVIVLLRQLDRCSRSAQLREQLLNFGVPYNRPEFHSAS